MNNVIQGAVFKKCPLFWDATAEVWQLVIDVSGQPIGHAFKVDALSDCLTVENGPICCPEMMVTTK